MPVATLCLAGQVGAQAPAANTEKELVQRLERSEARAVSLQQRLDELERRIQALGAGPSPQAQAAPRPGPASSPPPGTPGNRTAAARGAPGAFEVDEEAAQRALERTLTQSGALLLPTGTFEFTPRIAYQHSEQDGASIVPTTAGAAALVNSQIRTSQLTTSLDFRTGLPFGTQLELSLPYSFTRRSVANSLPSETSDSGRGIGDITVGLAKTLVRERRWIPDLIGRLNYNFGNGKKQADGVALGGGYRQMEAEFVALKRQDPLAFVASTFYNRVFEDDSIKPGDLAGISLQTILAASPATSLQLGFSQLRRQEQEFRGSKIGGSDQTFGLFTVGASSVLSRDLTLVTQIGLGLGNDAPKYSFTVALPILFR